MARKLVVEIVGDARSLERAFKKSSKSANTFGRSVEKTQTRSKRAFGGMTRGVVGLAGAFIGTAGLVGAARAAFGEMAEAQKVTAQTNAVLKSTGKAAKVSAKQVEGMAESLMMLSGVDDELIQQGENMLLTFTNIRNETGKGNDIFTRATRTALDMSVALGQDMTRSAMQLGKALNDPIKGVTALRRVGVQFTDAQTDQIKALVKSGKTLQAQKIILRELQREFGGSAKAAGETLPGKLDKLKNTLANLGGEIATLLTPAITKLVDKMVTWLSKSENQKKVIDAVTTAGHALKTVLDTLVGAFKILSRIVGGNKNAIIALVAAYATFKAIQIASTVTNLASSFGLLARRTNAAKAANTGLTASFLGKAGLVAAVGVASFEITSMILKMTKLDKKLKDFGAGVFDVAQSLGLVGQSEQEAEQAALARIAKQNPRAARRSQARLRAIERGDVHVDLHIDGKKIGTVTAPHTENALTRRRRQRAHQRRSTR